MRKVLWGAAAVLLALAVFAGVLLVRTWTLGVPPGGGATPAPPEPSPVAVDVQGAARRLGEAVRIPTVSHQDPRENDPAAWTQLHDWIARTYPRFSAVARRESPPGTAALLWTWPGGDPSLAPVLLMAHQDVVPVAPETAGEWRRPPFSGELAEGAVWGRGSIDDKGSLVALLEAAEALAAKGYRPRRTILIASGHDEEAGGTGARAVAALLKARGVRPLFALDEGSVVIADHPVTGGPVAIVGVAEKGYSTLTVEARGEGGHSSAPPKETAVVSLARAVERIAGRPFPLRYRGVAAEGLEALAPDLPFVQRLAVANAWLFRPLLVSTFAKTPQGAAMLHTTLAPTMLEGSPKENVLPQTARARINYRIAPGDTSADVMARARKAVAGLPVRLLWETPPNEPTPVSSTRSEGWRRVTSALAASYGGRPPPISPGLVIAATDGRAMSGVAQDVYRLQPIRFALKDTGRIHGVNERLAVEDLRRMVEFYARLMTQG